MVARKTDEEERAKKRRQAKARKHNKKNESHKHAEKSPTKALQGRSREDRPDKAINEEGGFTIPRAKRACQVDTR